MAATKIATDDKETGDIFSATEYNEIKSVVNDNADDLDLKQRGTAYSNATLVHNVAKALFTVTCGNGVNFGLILKYNIGAVAGTDFQSLTGHSLIAGYNTGSAIASEHAETERSKLSTGTLTAAVTIVDNADDTCTVKLTAATSLTEPTITVHWLVENLSSQTITPA